MAFAFGRSLGTANSKTANQASTTLVTSAALNSGELGVIIIGVDNNQTTDGDEVAVTSITDTSSNTWVKGKEFTNGQGAAQSGATCSLWYTNCTSTMASSGTITINFSNSASRDASACTAAAFTKTGTASVEGTPGSLADDNQDPGSLNVTTANIECLRIRGIATETSTTSPAFAKTAAFDGTFTDAVTSGGAGATNMAARGEYDISTGTSQASDPTLFGATDHASVYVAFKESGAISVSVTGNSSAGAAGDVTVSGKANVTPTGVSSTVSVGTLTVTLNTPVTITGNSSTGSVGTITVSAKANVTPTGVSSTGAVGTPTVSGKANVTLTGNSSTGDVGTPTVSGKAVVPITGNSSTGAAGDVTVNISAGGVSVTANVTGVSSTVSVGTLTASAGLNVSVTLTGVQSNVRAGTVTATGFEEVLGKPFTFERRMVYSSRLPIMSSIR